MRKILHYIYYWLPPLIWMGLIYFMSSQRSVGMTHNKTGDFFVFKSLHMVEYAFLFFLLYRAFHTVTARSMFWYAFSLATLYSITDEFHQLYIATRQGGIRDVLFDIAGMIIMYGIIRKIRIVRTLL